MYIFVGNVLYTICFLLSFVSLPESPWVPSSQLVVHHLHFKTALRHFVNRNSALYASYVIH